MPNTIASEPTDGDWEEALALPTEHMSYMIATSHGVVTAAHLPRNPTACEVLMIEWRELGIIWFRHRYRAAWDWKDPDFDSCIWTDAEWARYGHLGHYVYHRRLRAEAQLN